ncbi:MAG: peptide deformylase [Chloroflexi bacterium]|jgi:peptide deformylase|nr:peptide deformylase [Chloroflexota bacterium]
MAIREIVTIPNSVLRRKARKVTEFGPELQTLLDDMVDTMRAAPGVGLAGPQVGVPLRVIVVEYGEREEDGVPPRLYKVVNPEIVRASAETEMGAEGCLSIPGYLGDVERSVAVTVKGFNSQGKPIRIKASGWLARIFQHEIDHLDGILFTDRAEKIWKIESETAETESAD